MNQVSYDTKGILYFVAFADIYQQRENIGCHILDAIAVRAHSSLR